MLTGAQQRSAWIHVWRVCDWRGAIFPSMANGVRRSMPWSHRKRSNAYTTTSADRQEEFTSRAFTAHAVVRNRVRNAIHSASRRTEIPQTAIDNRQRDTWDPMNGCFVGDCARAIVVVFVTAVGSVCARRAAVVCSLLSRGFPL